MLDLNPILSLTCPAYQVEAQVEAQVKEPSQGTRLRCAHYEGQEPTEFVWFSSLVKVEDKVESVKYSWFV